MNGAMYAIDSVEGPYVSGKEFPDGNTGHRPPIKGGYFPVPPVDSQADLRAEMLLGDGRYGAQGRKAPPRGGALPGRIGLSSSRPW